jgi:hypothetical protein
MTRRGWLNFRALRGSELPRCKHQQVRCDLAESRIEPLELAPDLVPPRCDRAAKWAKRLALGDAAAAQHLAHRRLGLRSASLRPDLHAHMRMMRLARSIKRDERVFEKQRLQRLEAKRLALINYARYGPGQSFRPGGKCAYVGCDCEGSLPDHFVLCVVRGCHCSGTLHPLP